MNKIKFRFFILQNEIIIDKQIATLDEILCDSPIYLPAGYAYIENQYTGLKDKNSVEIYEGDICRHGEDIANIIFWEGAFIFKKYCMHDFALTNFACCRTFEVIGNIYENPELLEDN